MNNYWRKNGVELYYICISRKYFCRIWFFNEFIKRQDFVGSNYCRNKFTAYREAEKLLKIKLKEIENLNKKYYGI